MIITEHLCGVAIAYTEQGSKRDKSPLDPKSPGRPQGSIVNYQRRQIADACEWLRTRSEFAPRIFVATTSPNWGAEIYNPKISEFCHNLRNGYGCRNYVWVREFNSKGAPHYHFVADMDRINDPVGLSLYWSGLFGYKTPNCVRLGTKPDKNGRRKYVLDSPKMAFYMGKYFGKDLAQPIFKNSWKSAKMPGRSFGISQQTGKQSQPVKYEVNYHFEHEEREVLTESGYKVIKLARPIGVSYENDCGLKFNKNQYQWRKSEIHNVWFGRKIATYP